MSTRKYLILLLTCLLSLSVFMDGRAAKSSAGDSRLSKEGRILYNQARSNRDNKSCLDIADRLYNLELKKGNKLGCCNALCLKVHYWSFQNDDKEFQTAIKNLRELSKQINDDVMYYYSYYAECEYYTESNRSLKSLSIIRTLTNENKTKHSLAAEFVIDVALGDVYRTRLDEVHARDYYLQAIEKSKSLNNSSYLSPIYINLARITQTQNVKMRESYLLSALKNSINPTDSAAALMGLAHLYSYENNSKYFWNVYHQYKPLLNREHISEKKYEKWFKANEAYRMALEGKHDSASIMRQSISNPYMRYQAQADYYASHDDYKMACVYFDSIVTYLRSSQAQQNVSDVAEMSAIYDNQHLRSEAEEMKESFSRNILATTLISVLLVLVGLVIWLLRRHQYIKRLKTLSEELLQARDEAVKASKMKDVFIQNMSHEVRTPLNAITGFAQLLALPEECFPQHERQEFIQHIQNNTQMLTMLVDDILNISDIESGDYHMVITPNYVNDICRTSLSTVKYRITDDMELKFTTDVEDSFQIETDARRVQQVLINFLTNSIKHTIKGTITLNVSIKENPGSVTFSVADNGEGIPKDKSKDIFKRFEKLNAFVQGTGLGLNICRIIADKLHGVVDIDTTYPEAFPGVEHGARFFFILPVKQS